MDGWKLSRALQQHPEHSSIPVLVISAELHASNKPRVVGARGHLTKPFELSELLRLVRATLSAALRA